MPHQRDETTVSIVPFSIFFFNLSKVYIEVCIYMLNINNLQFETND